MTFDTGHQKYCFLDLILNPVAKFNNIRALFDSDGNCKDGLNRLAEP